MSVLRILIPVILMLSAQTQMAATSVLAQSVTLGMEQVVVCIRRYVDNVFALSWTCLTLSQQHAVMEISFSTMVLTCQLITPVELFWCALTIYMVLCVMTSGMLWMPVLYAVGLDSTQQVCI